jgi:hypothetical protein
LSYELILELTLGSRPLSDIAAASYCLRVSSEVFQQTGYVPALTRPTFGISEGANARSPIEEMESRRERMLFIRTDYLRPDHATGKSVEMAEFRRHTPRVANYTDHPFLEGGKTIVSLLQVLLNSTSSTRPTKSTAALHTFNLSAPMGGADGIDYPAPGSNMQIVIEARLDGKAHENSWARLPQVGIFKNWGQANSFAVRVEWETEEGSCIWRYRYVQCTKYLHTMVEQNVPGSLLRYAKGIAIVHWIFGVPPDWDAAWIEKPAGCMRVLQAERNFMTQSVRFVKPTKPYNALSFARNPGSNIALQMEQLNVVQRQEDCKLKGNSRRINCDLCIFLAGAVQGTSCTREGKDGRICTMCREWGLPFCSWSSYLQPYDSMHITNSASGATGDDMAIYRRVEAALWASPIAETTGLTLEQKPVSLQDAGVDEESDDEGMYDEDTADADGIE